MTDNLRMMEFRQCILERFMLQQGAKRAETQRKRQRNEGDKNEIFHRSPNSKCQLKILEIFDTPF